MDLWYKIVCHAEGLRYNSQASPALNNVIFKWWDPEELLTVWIDYTDLEGDLYVSTQSEVSLYHIWLMSVLI